MRYLEHIDTSASHRPVIGMHAYMLLQQVWQEPLDDRSEDEPVPSATTIGSAVSLIRNVPPALVEGYDVSPFYGELHLSWKYRNVDSGPGPRRVWG